MKVSPKSATLFQQIEHRLHSLGFHSTDSKSILAKPIGGTNSIVLLLQRDHPDSWCAHPEMTVKLATDPKTQQVGYALSLANGTYANVIDQETLTPDFKCLYDAIHNFEQQWEKNLHLIQEFPTLCPSETSTDPGLLAKQPTPIGGQTISHSTFMPVSFTKSFAPCVNPNIWGSDTEFSINLDSTISAKLKGVTLSGPRLTTFSRVLSTMEELSRTHAIDLKTLVATGPKAVITAYDPFSL